MTAPRKGIVTIAEASTGSGTWREDEDGLGMLVTKVPSHLASMP